MPTSYDVLDVPVARHGEGPVWDASEQKLFWVDMVAGEVRVTAPGGDTEIIEIRESVGCVAVVDESTLIVGCASGFALVDRLTANSRPLVPVLADSPELVMNDGKCDPSGRFLAGSISLRGTAEVGSLYRLGEDLSVEVLFNGLTIPNGLCWSEDGSRFFYIDSPKQRVDVWRYDAVTAALAFDRSLATFPEDMGLPDGMTIDAEGGLWIAFWGGGAVRRIDSTTGEVTDEIALPVTHPTSCCFGGRDLSTLHVTSSREFLSASEREDQPYAGSVFVLDVGCRGLAGGQRFGTSMTRTAR